MIVIPMAGESRRFSQAGYLLPKYMLPLNDRSVFDCVLRGFDRYFRSLPFLFVVRDTFGAPEFVRSRCAALGIEQAKLAVLDRPTAGQAETVEMGLDVAAVDGNEQLTIFNIDTIRPGFAFPDQPWFGRSDGYLEVFRGAGANWSYVRPGGDAGTEVTEVAEKVPISDLCCTGLYHFHHAGAFREALIAERLQPSAAELYVAPLYNHLIRKGGRVHYSLIRRDDVLFCGVPDEYTALGGQPPEAVGAVAGSGQGISNDR